LTGFLKSNAIWFAAFKKIRSNKGSKTAGLEKETIDELTKNKILEIKRQVLKGRYE